MHASVDETDSTNNFVGQDTTGWLGPTMVGTTSVTSVCKPLHFVVVGRNLC